MSESSLFSLFTSVTVRPWGLNSVLPSGTADSRILRPGKIACPVFHPGPSSGPFLQSCVLSPGRPRAENLTLASVCHPNPACGRVSKDLAPNFRKDFVNPRSVNVSVRSIFVISCWQLLCDTGGYPGLWSGTLFRVQVHVSRRGDRKFNADSSLLFRFFVSTLPDQG